jgi:hypothetical protein
VELARAVAGRRAEHAVDDGHHPGDVEGFGQHFRQSKTFSKVL